jgi:hypothetical protein
MNFHEEVIADGVTENNVMLLAIDKRLSEAETAADNGDCAAALTIIVNLRKLTKEGSYIV